MRNNNINIRGFCKDVKPFCQKKANGNTFQNIFSFYKRKIVQIKTTCKERNKDVLPTFVIIVMNQLVKNGKKLTILLNYGVIYNLLHR